MGFEVSFPKKFIAVVKELDLNNFKQALGP
jgi:hypothetical protein